MRSPRRHHRLFVPLAVGALILSIATPAVAAEPRGPVPVGTDALATDSWLVTLIGDEDPAVDATALARAAGGGVGLVYRHAMRGFQFKGSSQAAEALRRNPKVASVQADAAVYLTDLLPNGVDRIAAWDQAGSDGAYQQGFRGAGARIAIMDTGIDMDHPDLVGGIDAGLGANCVNPELPPNDGYGHGTHVAGTAAAPYNGIGIVGVAPQARLVPVKVFDDAGNSAESIILCGLDHIIGLATDADPLNDIDVVNMSWGEQRAWGDCASDRLHGAICRAYDAGIIMVGGAGNSAVDAGSFVPAAYPEVIGVSALADFDGAPGGQAGCPFVLEIFWFECDDSFALFSNYGPVDVIAPGVQEYSTWAGGGYQTSSGTSMATPHITGIAALMAAAAPGLTPDAALAALLVSGECPDGRAADADATAGCVGQGTWPDDPDGVPEPLGHALRAAQAVSGGLPPPPTAPSAPTLSATAGDGSVALSWTTPSDDGGASISGYEIYRGGSPGTATLLTSTGNVLTYTDTSVANGTTYWYQVAAVNSVDAGTRSNEVSARPQAGATAPSAPLGLTARKAANGIQLAWSAPASTGGSPITAYRVHRSTAAGAETLLAQVSVNQRNFLDTTAAKRITYFYIVTAVNAVGEGPRSNEVSVRR